MKGKQVVPVTQEFREMVRRQMKKQWRDNLEFRNRMMGANSSSWKGGRRKHKAGYILLYQPLHPRADKSGKSVFEHILVAEKAIGRLLNGEEVIHHINEAKADNRPENLYIFENINEHTRYHVNKNRAEIRTSNLPILRIITIHRRLMELEVD